MTRALLISCYEQGRQPLGLAGPLAFLERAGISAEAIDLELEDLDEDAVRRADAVALSVPMHTALKLGLRAAARIREIHPSSRLAFYGHYATLNAELLLDSGADAVLSGECEEALARWVKSEASGPDAPPPVLDRLDFSLPQRSRLSALDRYVHIERADGTHEIVGSVEASRGCRHTCRHCPLPPIYGGRFFVVPRDVVLADIAQLVERGARHINFTDPDFLNGPRHALEIVRALHREHPELTFDFTAKIEHLLKRRDDLAELADAGCAFIVSAVESLSERVLAELEKNHTAEDVSEVLALTRRAGIALRPTFVAFTPWTTYGDYRELFQWVLDEDLVEQVDPIQLTLRLLVPPGALLLENPGLLPYLGELDPDALTYRWSHPDPNMDQLQKDATAIMEAATREGRTNREVFGLLAKRVGLEAHARAGGVQPAPRLTEAWFC